MFVVQETLWLYEGVQRPRYSASKIVDALADARQVDSLIMGAVAHGGSGCLFLRGISGHALYAFPYTFQLPR